MSNFKMDRIADTEIADSRWKDLYKIGGAGAIIAAISLLIEVIIFAIWPIPTTVVGYFTLFESNSLIGLLEFYLLQVIAYIFFIPMFLAIYAVLRRVNESYMALAMIFAFIGITIFLATNNSFSMLSLSDQYAAATTEVQKSMILVAGQTIIVNTGQRAVGGFNMGLFFVSIAGLLVSYVTEQYLQQSNSLCGNSDFRSFIS